jgi:hypothetical protein
VTFMSDTIFRKSEVCLTPTMWRRLFRNKWSYTEFYDLFKKVVDKQELPIRLVPDSNGWRHVVRGLMYGYLMFFVLSSEEKYENRFRLNDKEKHFRAYIFEDFTEHAVRHVLREKWGYTAWEIVKVDHISKDFRGLDFVIVDNNGEWRTGIQCKSYMEGGRTKTAEAKGSYFSGTGVYHMLGEGRRLRKTYPDKHFALFYWFGRADPHKKRETGNLNKLNTTSDSWHNVVYFDEGSWIDTGYLLTLDHFADFVKSMSGWHNR